MANQPGMIKWNPSLVEHYCVDTYQPIRNVEGARCQPHDGHKMACYKSTRAPLCTHDKVSNWGSQPWCEICGRFGTLDLRKKPDA